MTRRRSWRMTVLALTVAAAITGLAAASGGRSSTHAAWSWSTPVPGDPVGSGTGSASDVRVLARAGTFTLDAANEDGALMIGTAADGSPQLQPLAALTGDAPLVVFTSAAADPGVQAVVGVARADVDRITASLADGSNVELPLNQWRGFSYTSSAPAQAAVAIRAYAVGSSVGAVTLPPTTVAATRAATTTSSVPVFGIARAALAAQTLRISRIDPRTLHPLAGRQLVMRCAVAGPIALSPDATKLALVTAPSYVSAEGARLQIVDLRRMVNLHTFPLGKTTIRALSWPTENSLLELRQTMRPPYQRDVATRSAWSVNPLTGAHTDTGQITNKLAVMQAIATPQGLTLFLATSGLHAHRDAQVVVISATGQVRAITLPLRSIKNASIMSRMAVDGASGHAYVVAPGGVVFDIDEQTMTFARHQVAPPPQLTQPAAIGIPATDVIDGKLVLAGIFHNATGTSLQGVTLVDPQDWSTRVVDPTASRFVVLGDRLLTYGTTTRAAAPNDVAGHGLTLYDATGQQLAHLYASRRFENILLTPSYGHVIYNGRTSGTQPKPGLRYRRGTEYYAGPNDQLEFNLTTGAAAGSGPISTQKPPLGPPILVFRGSQNVGETGARASTAREATTPQPTTNVTTVARATAAARVAATARARATATARVEAAARARAIPSTAATRFATAAPLAVAAQRGYTISNLGRLVQGRGRSFFDDPHVKPQVYLLGTVDGRAFYRVQVAPHFRCWGSGDASAVGQIGSLGCPTVVGAYPLQQDDEAVSMSISKPGSGHGTARVTNYLRIDGIVADGAATVDLRTSSGKTIASAPVNNNLFTFPPPYPKQFVHLVPVDANGNDLPPHPQWGEHQQQPPFLFGPRATKVSPAALGHVIQQGRGDGVNVSVGSNGVVDVQLGSISAQTRRLISGRNVGINCFSVSPTIRHSRGAGVSANWGTTTELAFKILGYIKPPFDGCEIASTVGHRWHDQWGTHSPVEVPLTKRGTWYFTNRAAARDLALFIRSGTMHRLRKLKGAAFITAVRKQYGNVVVILSSATASAPAGRVGIWASSTKTIVSEQSGDRGRFYVEIDNGHITKENVRGLAFIF
jgi:hypothetical protein